MTNWEILKVTLHQPRDPRLAGCHLEFPKPGITSGQPLVEVAGWALERAGPALAVELTCGGKTCQHIAMSQRRPELAASFPTVPRAEQGGFRTAVGIVGLKEQELLVRAVLRDQSRVPVGSIRLRRSCAAEEKSGPLVSVVIPCYRQAQFLGEAIESVLGQTYPNLEVVVVDDGSPDNTQTVTARYPGVMYIRQENGWVSAARNTGLERSSGNFVMFLDGDDRLLPSAVRAGVEQLLRHPEYGFTSGQFRFIDSEGKVTYVPKIREIHKDHYQQLLLRNYISMLASVMYRRSILQEVGGFDTKLRGCEDYELFLRITRSHPVGCHDQIVAEYRRHGDNMSRDAARMMRTAVKALGSQARFVEGNRDCEEAYRKGMKAWRKLYGGPLLAEIGAWLHDGHLKHAGHGMLAILRYYPRLLLREVKCHVKDDVSRPKTF